jgi:hypothetical protein
VRLPKLDRILLAEGELQPLMAKARDLRTLAGLLDGFLPPDLVGQATVANFREGELVLLGANAAAAAKLRLLAPSLSAYLSKQPFQVNSVSIRVQPNTSRAPSAATQKNVRLSPHTINTLRALHDRMRASPAREALGRLLDRQSGAEPLPPTKKPRG